MAILSSDGKSVTVQKGDTLWGIASTYLGSGTKYKQLAAINNISNPSLIYIGQVVKLTNESGSSSGTSTTSSTSKATINQFGMQSNADGVLFATWTWTKSNTDSYKVVWTYDTGNGVWFVGNSSTNTVDEDDPALSRQSTYNVPSNAVRVQFKVKPISKTYKKNDVDTNYWDASWSDVKTWTDSTPLDTPSTPSVSIDKYKLTATIENVGVTATSIQFQIVKDNSSVFKTGTANIQTNYVSYSCSVDAGSQYKVRCRACSNGQYSEWSEYSSNVKTIPAASSGITTIRANSSTSVYLEWSASATATSYDLEYATKKDYFDGSDQTTTINTIEFTHYEKTGLESGQEYFFRVRAVNAEGESSWSEIKSVVVGKDPAAPTTWSSTTTGIVGEPIILYWVHNSEDGSSQTYAEVELYIDGAKETYTVKNTEDEEEKDKTSTYSLDTSLYSEGVKIQWRVRTAGITKAYGDWSVQRTIDIYAPVTLEIGITDKDGNTISVLSGFPFYFKGLAGPKTQAPIGYNLTITANSGYETIDKIGNEIVVNAGDKVYSKYFDTSEALLVELSASNIDLENNIEYTASCKVSMNSGLTAEESLTFSVTWTDDRYEPNAEIGIDEETMTASIRPYCEDSTITIYQVSYTSNIYTKTSTTIDLVFGSPVSGASTSTGEQVYSGTTADGDDVYYCIVETRTPVTDVLLSVYRREFDGSFTELATGLDATKNITITDPHPSLDYARYRIVATSIATGAVSYYDPPGYPVGGKAVIIQWDEEWTTFETSEESALEEQPWAGSMLKLPYNIDVSDNHASDVSLVEYIGRKRPVSYYGTQLGETSTWSVEIDRKDIETLYALRRLAIWMGDVYVREPSGSGYWAHISVSFSQTHCELTIPVTLDITRVEGGV